MSRNAKVRRVKVHEAVPRDPPVCSWHRPSRLGYLAAAEDAEQRMARGEEQRQCLACGRWLWAHEFGEGPA